MGVRTERRRSSIVAWAVAVAVMLLLAVMGYRYFVRTDASAAAGLERGAQSAPALVQPTATPQPTRTDAAVAPQATSAPQQATPVAQSTTQPANQNAPARSAAQSSTEPAKLPASTLPGTHAEIPRPRATARPAAVPAPPASEQRTLKEEQINAFLASHPESIKPAESITVRFVPGEAQADVNVMGSVSTAHAGLAAKNGRIVAVNPRLDGPLSYIVSAQDLATSLEEKLNQQLSAKGRRITEVQIKQGEIVVQVEK